MTTHYIWDVVNDSYLMETDGDGNVTAEYTTEPVPYGRVISQRRGNATSIYHYDGQGSTRQLTDESGNVTDEYTYSAFGDEIAHVGTSENPFRYKGAFGYYTNSATGDVYVRERVYDPIAGRWLSIDPLGFIDGINGHEYVGNEPVNRADPSGTFTIDPPIWLPGVGVATACSCCCCAERATFSQCARWKAGDCGLRGQKAGWTFSVDLLTEWKSHSTSGDCTVEWWEKASLATPFNPNPQTWKEDFRPQLLMFKPWRERRKPCFLLANILNKERVTFTDCPTMQFGPRVVPAKYDLAIAIKLTSAADCDCSNRFCVHYMQCRIWTMQRGRGSVLDPNNFKCLPVNVFDPIVGGNPPGTWPAAGCQ